MSVFSVEAEGLLDDGLVGRIAFLGGDGAPRVLPIWYVRDSEVLLMTTGAGSYKVRRMAADPRVALEVSTATRPYRIVTVTGRILIEPLDGAEKLQVRRRIARRYVSEADAETYARLGYPTVRLSLRPDRVRYVDLGRR